MNKSMRIGSSGVQFAAQSTVGHLVDEKRSEEGKENENVVQTLPACPVQRADAYDTQKGCGYSAAYRKHSHGLTSHQGLVDLGGVRIKNLDKEAGTMKHPVAKILRPMKTTSRKALLDSPATVIIRERTNMIEQPRQTERFLPYSGWSITILAPQKAKVSTALITIKKMYWKFSEKLPLFRERIDGSMSMMAQQRKQAAVQAKHRIKVCFIYFQLKSKLKLPSFLSAPYSRFYLLMISISSDSDTSGTLFSVVIMSMISLADFMSPLAHTYLRLYRPWFKISQMAQKLGKQRTKRSILQWLPMSKIQPATQANRQPNDQQTLEILRMRARWVPGTTSVMQVAVRGRAMPMPIPQKKRTTRKK